MFEWMKLYTRDLLRVKSDLFFTMIFPIMMVVVLGNMLSSLDSPDTPLGTIRIAYSTADMKQVELPSEWTSAEELPLEWSSAEGPFWEGLPDIFVDPGMSEAALEEAYALMESYVETSAVNAFAESFTGEDEVEMSKAADAEAARAEVDAGTADAALIFESPLRVKVAEGDDIYKNRAVTLIAQSFARHYAAYTAAAKLAPETFMKTAAGAWENTSVSSGLTKDKDLGVSRSMMDYYAVTMIVMIAFMGGAIGGATSMYFARQDGTLRRMVAAPRGRARLFLEAVAGALPQNVFMTACVMAPAALFFGAHYAKTWQDNLLLFAFFTLLGLAVTAVFMLVGLFVRVNPYMPLMALTWSLLFVSGTFHKEMLIEGFSEYLPMNIAQRAVFDLTVFGRSEQVLTVMIVCAAVLAVSCVTGAALFKRKGIML